MQTKQLSSAVSNARVKVKYASKPKSNEIDPRAPGSNYIPFHITYKLQPGEDRNKVIRSLMDTYVKGKLNPNDKRYIYAK